MTFRLNISVVFIAAILLIPAGCNKDPELDPLPDLTIRLKPEKGLTTETFSITVVPATGVTIGTTLFYRWDWDNDGIWDTPFSTSNQVSRRFLKPGTLLLKLEVADGKKQVRTEEITLTVEQGHSAPRPVFVVSPEKGNILTQFSFDASTTKDDEDSLNQLQFRWDFKGDGDWMTEYSKSPAATWQYSLAGVYTAKLEAKDPSGKTAVYSRELVVNMEDTLIFADFTINDSLIRVGDTLLLDASASVHTKYPGHGLICSWLLPDRVEWTVADVSKTRTLILQDKGPALIQLKVIDQVTKMYNIRSKEIYVADKNLPPTARITVGSATGNLLTQFFLSSWACTDDSQAPSELEVRWDFNGDGYWDTPWTREKVLYHQYESPGTYNLGLQVRDLEGLATSTQKKITVSANTNPTGYFMDGRDGNYYGTVQIGDQWWMSQNLNFVIPGKQREGILSYLCLFEQAKWCDLVGKIYRISAVIESHGDEEYVPVCPPGWRMPSQSDWENLFNSIGGGQNAKELRSGGKYDFNALDLGYGVYEVIWENFHPVDTIYHFNETFQKAFFFSTSKPYDPTGARSDIWQWEIDKATTTFWSGYGSTNIYMPVRCVKEN